MAIDLGARNITIKESIRIWRIQIESPRGQLPVVEVFYERVAEPSEGEATTYPDFVPVRIPADVLHELAPFCEIPPELQPMIRDEATLTRYLKILPALVSIAGDAAKLKAEHEAKLPSVEVVEQESEEG